ncbi:MAG: POTRA domain-containing protein [Phascolarctobacterium faecium]
MDKVSLQKLNTLVSELNKLYEDKGYLTCRAVLPPQTIKEGIVHINLVEGRTGQLIMDGNKSTNSRYIQNRLHLHKDRIDNVHELNKDLLRFNAPTMCCAFLCRQARKLVLLIML